MEQSNHLLRVRVGCNINLTMKVSPIMYSKFWHLSMKKDSLFSFVL